MTTSSRVCYASTRPQMKSQSSNKTSQPPHRTVTLHRLLNFSRQVIRPREPRCSPRSGKLNLHAKPTQSSSRRPCLRCFNYPQGLISARALKSKSSPVKELPSKVVRWDRISCSGKKTNSSLSRKRSFLRSSLSTEIYYLKTCTSLNCRRSLRWRSSLLIWAAKSTIWIWVWLNTFAMSPATVPAQRTGATKSPRRLVLPCRPRGRSSFHTELHSVSRCRSFVPQGENLSRSCILTIWTR